MDAPKPRPFDVRMIETLIRLMAANDLSEIDLHEGDQLDGDAFRDLVRAAAEL